MFEFTENEKIDDTKHVRGIIASYREMVFTTALDDFGSGYSGLNLLSEFQTDLLKLDMELIRNIDSSMPRRMIVQSMVDLCKRMDIGVIAEGIETEAEYDTVRSLGIDLIQDICWPSRCSKRFLRWTICQRQPPNTGWHPERRRRALYLSVLMIPEKSSRSLPSATNASYSSRARVPIGAFACAPSTASTASRRSLSIRPAAKPP